MFSPHTDRQRGNVMVYILIAIALFGGLTLVLSRQNKQSENQGVSDEVLALQVKEVLEYVGAANGALDSMISTGTELSQLVFINPASANYTSLTPHFNVYHPSGGGLTPPPVNKKIFTGSATNPAAGWYIGRVNNVEGTPSSAHEVFVTAHQISQPLCAALNKRTIGSSTIPTLGAAPARYLVSSDHHSLGTLALTQAACSTCYDKTALCVSNTGGTAWTFYSIIGVQ